MKFVAYICIAIFAAFSLSGCTGLIIGGAAATGVAVAEERSVGTVIDDATIKTQIMNGIFQKSEPLFTDTSSTVIDGVVLMTGQVPTPEDRVTIARIVWGIKGVKEFHNEVTIADSESLSSFGDDTLITAKLKLQLLRDSEVLNINYSVDTVNGVVYLMGIAQNQAELDRVKNHAKEISGVRRIVSYVQLKQALKNTA